MTRIEQLKRQLTQVQNPVRKVGQDENMNVEFNKFVKLIHLARHNLSRDLKHLREANIIGIKAIIKRYPDFPDIFRRVCPEKISYLKEVERDLK